MRRCAEQCLAAVLAGVLAVARLSGAEPLAPAVDSGARAAREPVDSRIDVERGPGSGACPDAAAVFRSIARLFPERSFRETADAASATASARVVIRAVPAGYEAVLSTSAPHAGERLIAEKDPACAGLADALALAFVMLVEPPAGKAASQSGTSVPASTGPPSSPSASAPAAPTKFVAPAPGAANPDAAPGSTHVDKLGARRARSFIANIAASGLGGFGLLSQPAGGIAAGVELVHQSGWGVSLAGVRAWSPPSDAGGGSVRLSLWALLAGPCYERQLRGASSLDACVRLGAGAQHAQVHGFLLPRSPSVSWLIITPTLGFRLKAAEVLTGFVRVGPLVQLRPQSFSALAGDGSGRTVQVAGAPNVGVMAELGLLAGNVGF